MAAAGFEEAVYVVFGCVAVGTIAAFVYTSTFHKLSKNADFVTFQYKYLGIYLVAMMADWLQGPYLYRLYEHYGFLEEQIAALYISGFVSSMLFGPLLGNLADRYGRRRLCITFCYLYSLSCLMKLSSSFFLLMLGRILGGLSTSLLTSAFESWMIYQHNKKGFPEEWVSRTFAIATFGNGVVAVLSGVLANFVAELHGHHPLRPFLLSVCFLVLCAYLIMTLWEEDEPELLLRKNAPCGASVRTIFSSRKILLLGAVQATFEAAMYMFVFMWTPVLDPRDVDVHPPLGVIFGTFMLAIMAGSCAFRFSISKSVPVMQTVGYAFATAAVCLFGAAAVESRSAALVFFIVFEACCGVVFPGLGTLRSELLPETERASIINIFRVPLNFMVVVFLTMVGRLTFSHLFALTGALCTLAFAAHVSLQRVIARELYDAAQQTAA
ncbi:hypothetical protein PTSG_04024 [Salpingoeca rosetta]|uniref:Molybdate-anion transporter n=1 Tax=Salpingoeca rosetta (strain ATCC 50818 / BSB-021) TaxID=946362 RepID=F2U7J9_SALR5|nr:uncharacterized protein PTSG_04024 [Salpingoeca rosetta]EGD83416.1 hypothetical protein PTSG_04024 [Salpingoeca rosetta]|eukprot:XP_004994920.1 hypothetical protein PTSG_04024 [Salpingoeca rosetta]